MGFVFPWFLAALAVLAIPVIIHLFYFRRFKKIYFPNVKFLREIQQEKSTVDRLKKRLVLASRLLALSFLVLAFAQPFFKSKDSAQTEGRAAVAVYLDNSYSMGLRKNGQSLLDIAKEKARSIASAYTSNDRFLLLTNDFEGKHQRWVSKEDFTEWVDKVEPSPQTRILPEVMIKDKSLFENAPAKNKTAFFLTDLQKYTVAPYTDTTFSMQFIPVTEKSPSNIYIDSCWFSTPIQSLNSVNGLVIRLKNSGESDEKPVRLSLKLNGKPKTISELKIKGGETLTDTLIFAATEPGWQSGELFFNDYPITFDDHFYFTFNVEDNRKVLSIEDGVAKPFIRSIFAADKQFTFQSAQKNSLDYSGFKTNSLIILNEPLDISSGLAASLTDYVNNGGNLYVIPSQNANIASYNIFLSQLGLDQYQPVETKNLRVTGINTQEEVFAPVFEHLPKNLDLPQIKKYFPLRGGNRISQRVLLPMDNGMPLVAKYQTTGGYVYLQSVPLGADFSSLAANAVFPPLVYNCAIFNPNRNQIYYTLGKDQVLELANTFQNPEAVFKMSGGNMEFIPSARPAGNKYIINFGTELAVPGIYSLSTGSSLLAKIAFNNDRRESEMSFYKPSELEKIYKDNKLQVLDESRANLTSAIKHIKQGMVLWKVCLIFALVFLAIEILLLRFLK